MAPVKQLSLSLGRSEGESEAGDLIEPKPIFCSSLLDRVLERNNLIRALKQVRRNKGAPGIDGMTVDGLLDFLRQLPGKYPTMDSCQSGDCPSYSFKKGGDGLSTTATSQKPPCLNGMRESTPPLSSLSNGMEEDCVSLEWHLLKPKPLSQNRRHPGQAGIHSYQ